MFSILSGLQPVHFVFSGGKAPAYGKYTISGRFCKVFRRESVREKLGG